MKYLERRYTFQNNPKIELNESQKVNLFKKSEMIKETFENDIPWGDSLVGRLINSFIRKAKININALRIMRIPPQVEAALNNMLASSVFTPEQKKQVVEVRIQLLLEAIIKEVKKDDKVSNKLTVLLGDKNNKGGLIDLTINDVEKVENFEDKDELLKKLRVFKEALIKMREENVDADEEDSPSPDEEENVGPDNQPDTGQGGNVAKPELTERIVKFFKSILDLFALYKNLPKEEPEPQNVKKHNGREVIIISKDKEKTGPGGDTKWNTNDDEFGKPPKDIEPETVQIIIKNPKTNKFDKDSKVEIVKADEIKESFVFEAVRPDVQKQIEAVKKKIGFAFSKNDFSGKETLLNKLFQLCESQDEVGLSKAQNLIKQVISLESKNGGVISFQELIKLNEAIEAENNEFNILSEPIASLVRVILPLKEKMDFLENFQKSKQSLINFIESYNYFKEKMGGTKSTDEEKTDSSEKETNSDVEKKVSDEKSSKENGTEKVSVNRIPGTDQFKKYDYKILKGQSDKVKDKFWELEEEIFNDQIKKGGNTKTGEGTRDRLLKRAKELVGESRLYNIGRYDNYRMIIEDVAGQLDVIYDEWRKQFTEDDEKKYAVNEQKARELQSASEKAESKKVNINLDNKDQFDSLMEIVDLFGRAYRLYTTNYIPSGRSGGKISMSTMNEYELIGSGDSSYSKSEWSPSENPGKGPWAARKVFDKWRNGILEILKNQKFRKILANSEFSYGGEVLNKGAGKTLLTFMNDMITLKDTFDSNTNKLITAYFNGEVADKLGDTIKKVQPGTRKIAEADKGKKGTLGFLKQQNGFIPADFKASGEFLKTFALLEGKFGAEQRKMIVLFDSFRKIGNKDYLLVKFHLTKTGKESIISSYLKEEMKSKNLQLDEELKNTPTQPIFVAAVELEGNKKFFKKGEIFNLKYVEGKSASRQKPTKLECKLTDDPFLLAYLDEDQKGNQTQKLIKSTSAPKDKPQGDPGNLNTLFQNRDVLRNFEITT